MSDAKVTPGDENTPAGDKPAEERTFTQSEVENMIRGRLAKFSDYDDVKKELDTIKSQNESEQDKAVKAARAEARNEVLTQVNARLVKAEARAVAAEAGWLYPGDAHRFIDAGAITVSDDGTVDVEALKSALADAAKERPALVKSDDKEIPTPSNAGIGVSAPSKPATAADAWARDVGTK